MGVIAVAPLFQVKDAEALRARLPQALKALAGLASRDGAGESAAGLTGGNRWIVKRMSAEF